MHFQNSKVSCDSQTQLVCFNIVTGTYELLSYTLNEMYNTHTELRCNLQ